MSEAVVTSTRLFVIWYNIKSLASAYLLARVTQFRLSSMVVTFFTDLMFFSVDGSHNVDTYSTMGLTNVYHLG